MKQENAKRMEEWVGETKVNCVKKDVELPRLISIEFPSHFTELEVDTGKKKWDIYFFSFLPLFSVLVPFHSRTFLSRRQSLGIFENLLYIIHTPTLRHSFPLWFFFSRSLCVLYTCDLKLFNAVVRYCNLVSNETHSFIHIPTTGTLTFGMLELCRHTTKYIQHTLTNIIKSRKRIFQPIASLILLLFLSKFPHVRFSDNWNRIKMYCF